MLGPFKLWQCFPSISRSRSSGGHCRHPTERLQGFKSNGSVSPVLSLRCFSWKKADGRNWGTCPVGPSVFRRIPRLGSHIFTALGMPHEFVFPIHTYSLILLPL